jgi:hypothetical protein
MSINCKEYSNFKDVVQLNYFKASNVLMSNIVWLEVWWNVFKNTEDSTIGTKKKLHFIEVTENENFVFFPIISLTRVVKGVSIRFVELLSQQWGGYENEILSNSKNNKILINEALNYIHIHIEYDICFLKYLLHNSDLNIKNSFLEHAAIPFIDLKKYKHFEDYKQQIFSKNLKKKLNNVSNKLRKNNVEFQIVKEDFSDDNFEIIKKISNSKLEDGKSYVYGFKDKSKFYKSIFKKLKAQVIFVIINSEYAAYRINIISNNKKHCIDVSYNRDFRIYDPGLLSVIGSIEDSFKMGLNIHSMGPGSDRYKFSFSDNVEFLYAYIKKGNTFKSLFLFPLFKILMKRKSKNIVEITNKFNLRN